MAATTAAILRIIDDSLRRARGRWSVLSIYTVGRSAVPGRGREVTGRA
jgi:hypothetical protein